MLQHGIRRRRPQEHPRVALERLRLIEAEGAEILAKF